MTIRVRDRHYAPPRQRPIRDPHEGPQGHWRHPFEQFMASDDRIGLDSLMVLVWSPASSPVRT